MRRLVTALGLGLALAACDGSDVPTVDVDQVLDFLAECPEGTVCDKVADGRSLVTVRACIKDTVVPPRIDAQLNLTLSAGRWEGQDATTRTVSASIQQDPCFTRRFITGTELSRVRVEAEVKGFRKSIELQLQPAPLTEIELVPAPLQLKAGQENQLQVRVRAQNAGTPTVGTMVAFSVEDVEPATGSAVVWPATTQVDTTGAALGRLLLSSDVTRLTVRVKATSPDAGAGPSIVERTFALTAKP